jgi:GMP synthase (glutamine-hydrolysing)
MDAVPRFLALQHIACEPPGAFEDELRQWGAMLDRIEIDAGEPLPDHHHDLAGIIVMGGPMGAHDDERFPWLTAEKRFIAHAVADDVPVWGVCLGAQLLAASLGANVHPGPEPEVGILPVQRTPAGAEDPVFSVVPERFRALQWHGDTFSLPPAASLLARSEAYEQQAFRVGRAYGLQFHVEVGVPLAGEWGAVPAYAASLEGILGPGALPALLEEIGQCEREMTELARRLFAAWLEHVVRLTPVSLPA